MFITSVFTTIVSGRTFILNVLKLVNIFFMNGLIVNPLFVVWKILIFAGSNPAPKSGTDVLLDLLSIGTTPPAQSSAFPTDILSNQEKSPTSQLDGLSSLSLLPASKASGPVSSSTIDLLGGLAPNVASSGGKLVNGTSNPFGWYEFC